MPAPEHFHRTTRPAGQTGSGQISFPPGANAWTGFAGWRLACSFCVLSGSVYEKDLYMFSLQNLLRKEDKLLTLLEASARQARSCVQALVAS